MDPGESPGQAITVDVRPGKEQYILVGRNVGGKDARTDSGRVLKVALVADRSDLPRCAIPELSPNGTRQTLERGRRNAIMAAVFLVLLAAGLFTNGVLSISRAPETGNFSIAVGVITALIGIFLGWKIFPGIRLLWNQRHWPFEDWRVESKGDFGIERGMTRHQGSASA